MLIEVRKDKLTSYNLSQTLFPRKERIGSRRTQQHAKRLMNFQEDNATAILEIISSNASYFLFEETSRIIYGQWSIYCTGVEKLEAQDSGI